MKRGGSKGGTQFNMKKAYWNRKELLCKKCIAPVPEVQQFYCEHLKSLKTVRQEVEGWSRRAHRTRPGFRAMCAELERDTY